MRPASRRFTALALAPFVGFLLVLGLYPTVQLVRMAASDVTVRFGLFDWRFVGLDNVTALASDPVAKDAAVATLVFTLGALPLSLALGTLLAVCVDRARLFGRLARTALLWPVVMTPVVISVLWLLVLSPTVGVLNRGLASLGLPEQSWLGEPAGAMATVVFVDVWHWTPLVFLIVYTALRNVDDGVIEAARLDGASERRLVLHVTLPMVAPAIAAAAVIRLVMCVKAFDEMFLLTKGGPGTSTTLVSLYIRTVFFDRRDLGYGAAFSVVVVLTLLAALGVVTLVRRGLARAGAA